MPNRNRRLVNKNDNKKKKSLRSIIKEFPILYYAIVGLIIFLALKLIQPATMMIIARRTIYDLEGTSYQLVQTDDTILRHILPYGFAVSMSASVALAFVLILFVTKYFCSINVYAPLLEVVTLLISAAIAISAVYTVGYGASKEIYQNNSEQFQEFLDEAHVMGSENKGEDGKQSVSIEMGIEESDTHTPVPQENYSSYAYDGSEHSQDSIILQMESINETISFIFAAAATLIIPLNYYKDKKNES